MIIKIPQRLKTYFADEIQCALCIKTLKPKTMLRFKKSPLLKIQLLFFYIERYW